MIIYYHIFLVPVKLAMDNKKVNNLSDKSKLKTYMSFMLISKLLWARNSTHALNHRPTK